MPLSKERNRDRMRLIRRNKRSLSPQECKSVQPRPIEAGIYEANDKALELLKNSIDADGNVIPDE